MRTLDDSENIICTTHTATRKLYAELGYAKCSDMSCMHVKLYALLITCLSISQSV